MDLSNLKADEELLTVLRPFAGKRVVLAGCGGGCDVFGAVVPFTMLKHLDPNTQIVLVNLSFTVPTLLARTAQPVNKTKNRFYEVPPGVRVLGNEYYPEARLANHLNHPVIAFSGDLRICDIAEGYADIFSDMFKGQAPDLICLVDGGCDAILTGLETGLATPVEDMAHIRAVNDVLPEVWAKRNVSWAAYAASFVRAPAAPAAHPVTARYILAVGTDVDCGHGVVYEELLQRLQHTKASGTQLAATTMELDDARDGGAAAAYHAAVNACHPVSTIVQSLVVASLDGITGRQLPSHLEARCGSVCAFPISALTRTFFAFSMEAIANEVLYLNRLLPKHGRMDVSGVVRNWYYVRESSSVSSQ